MIEIRRGTTNEFVIALTDEEGKPYSLSDADTLIFGIKRNVRQASPVFSKSFADYDELRGGYVIGLTPEDTQDLDFGNYVYDIGLQKSTGEFYIVCPCDTLIIADTVTEKV